LSNTRILGAFKEITKEILKGFFDAKFALRFQKGQQKRATSLFHVALFCLYLSLI